MFYLFRLCLFESGAEMDFLKNVNPFHLFLSDSTNLANFLFFF